MADYDKNFNSADYDRNRDKIKSRKRRSKDRNIDRKRRKQIASHSTTYFENDDVIMHEYVYEIIPEHIERRVRKYYDPYATDYMFDEDKQRVVRKKGREITEVTEIVVPEKRRVKRHVGYKVVKTPKYLKRQSESVIKKTIKKLSNKKIRNAKNDESTTESVKNSRHKKFFDHWWVD